jgi:hypothetical protein
MESYIVICFALPLLRGFIDAIVGGGLDKLRGLFYYLLCLLRPLLVPLKFLPLVEHLLLLISI